MSTNEHNSFAQKLAFHAAPTLLGVKCASLFSLSDAESDIRTNCDYFNHRAIARGLKTRILCSCKNRRLLLVYNEKLLAGRLLEMNVRTVLLKYGYDENFSVDKCLDRLAERITKCGEFPHEIGVFLDYPIEDVVGFIENKGENFKMCGAWKVYGSVDKAKRTFANYEKCRIFLCNKLNEGADIYQALRIS